MPMTRLEIPLMFHEPPTEPPSAPKLMQIYGADLYAAGAGRKIQPVLAGRTILRPVIDLGCYRARAEIDWIEIRLETPGRHQAINMQRAVTGLIDAQGGAYSVFITGPRGEKGYLGDQFILRFQDPDPGGLGALLDAILARYGDDTVPLDDLAIAAVEISVDFYVRPACAARAVDADRLRWLMVDLMRRHLRPEPVLTEAPLCRPRWFGTTSGKSGATFALEDRRGGATSRTPHFLRLGVDESYQPALSLSAHHQPPVDATYWMGAKGYPVALRSMDKITDRRDASTGTAVPLLPYQRRARLEVTLQGDGDLNGGHGAVGLATMGDLYGFKFESIRPPFFEFFLPTFGSGSDLASLPFSVKVTEQAVFERSGVYGLDRLHRSIAAVAHAAHKHGEINGGPTPLAKKGRLVAYVELNRRFDRALKGLSQRWRCHVDPAVR